jgi:hypothetical protein
MSTIRVVRAIVRRGLAAAWSQLLAIRLLPIPIGVGVGIGIGIDPFSFDSDSDSDTDPDTDPDYNPYRDRDAFVLY